MNKNAIKALELSIQHWGKNMRADWPEQASDSSKDCALCQAFKNERCNGCPVKESTGQFYCDNSPYIKATLAFQAWRQESESVFRRNNFIRRATQEWKFLRSLLPKDHPNYSPWSQPMRIDYSVEILGVEYDVEVEVEITQAPIAESGRTADDYDPGVSGEFSVTVDAISGVTGPHELPKWLKTLVEEFLEREDSFAAEVWSEYEESYE